VKAPTAVGWTSALLALKSRDDHCRTSLSQ
jgi:hypothetical protein